MLYKLSNKQKQINSSTFFRTQSDLSMNIYIYITYVCKHIYDTYINIYIVHIIQ